MLVSLKRATLKEPRALYEILELFLYKAEQTNVILVINSTKTMIRSTAMLTCSLVSFEIFIPHTIKLIIEPIFHRIVKTNLWSISGELLVPKPLVRLKLLGLTKRVVGIKGSIK